MSYLEYLKYVRGVFESGLFLCSANELAAKQLKAVSVSEASQHRIRLRDAIWSEMADLLVAKMRQTGLTVNRLQALDAVAYGTHTLASLQRFPLADYHRDAMQLRLDLLDRFISEEGGGEKKPVPQKHAALIKAWADGARIEHQSSNGTWSIVYRPVWNEDENYRIFVKPDHLAEIKDAFKLGKAIDIRSVPTPQHPNPKWIFYDGDIAWSDSYEYRLSKSAKFRLFWLGSPSGQSPTRPYVVLWDEEQTDPREKWSGFNGWIGDWQQIIQQ